MGRRKTEEILTYEGIIKGNRYVKDTAMKIGDHKLLCNLFDAQDKRTKQVINEAYDTGAILITDEVRKMLIENNKAIELMMSNMQERIFLRFDSLEGRVSLMEEQLKDLRKVADCTQGEVDVLMKDVEILKIKNADHRIKRRIWTGVWIGVAIMTVVYIPLTIFVVWYLYHNFWKIAP